MEAWFGDRGWIGIDPTNDRVVDARYIRLGFGRDYADVAPIKGSYRGPETTALSVTAGGAAAVVTATAYTA